MVELTKDADKLICSIYKMYLERRRDGVSKANAAEFEADFYKDDVHLASWNPADIADTLNELKGNKFIKYNICGEITIEPASISYMENRFEDKLSKVLDYISKIF